MDASFQALLHGTFFPPAQIFKKKSKLPIISFSLFEICPRSFLVRFGDDDTKPHPTGTDLMLEIHHG